MRATLIRRFGLNRAVVFSVLLKGWQSLSGLLGLILIGRYFAPEVQGYYYTFASLVALQSFVELGLYIVVSNVASHEWARLRVGADGHIEGDPVALSRLVSLGRFVFKWYAWAALAFFLIAGSGGYWFLERAQASAIDWRAPWILHMAFSAVLLWCMPFLSLLEGCNQFALVARFRILMAVVGSLGFWAAIVAGANLWAAPVLSAVSAIACIYYLAVTQRKFFLPFFERPTHGGMNWRRQILPMQWRLALQGVVSYLVFSLLTPVMFHYHGSVVAGQMGMTMQLVMAVQSIASIWVLTKVPRFGVLVAQGDFGRLDVEWRSATFLSVLMMVGGGALLVGSLYLLTVMQVAGVDRVLPPLAFVLLTVGALFSVGSQSLAIYLRAHKREVLMRAGLVSGVLMGFLVWQLGARYGPMGASASYMFVMSCVAFPMALHVWHVSRRDWHRTAATLHDDPSDA